MVTAMSAHAQERRRVLIDVGWKTKDHNSLAYIHSSKYLIKALTYVIEEQYILLEICVVNMESILINTHVKEHTATFMVNKSIAFRISSCTLTCYLSLLNHLSGVVNMHGWNA